MIKIRKFEEDKREHYSSFELSLYDKDADNFPEIKKAIREYLKHDNKDYRMRIDFCQGSDSESDYYDFYIDINKEYFDNAYEYLFNLIKTIKGRSSDLLGYKLLVEQTDRTTIFASVHPEVYELYLDQKNPGPDLMYYPHYSTYEDLYDASEYGGSNFEYSEFEPYKSVIRYNS